MFISHVGIAPSTGKLVKDSVGMDGLFIEYRVEAYDDPYTIAATPELSDVYENAPALFDVGAVSEKDASAKTYTPDLGPSVKGPNVGSAASTVSVVLTLALR